MDLYCLRARNLMFIFEVLCLFSFYFSDWCRHFYSHFLNVFTFFSWMLHTAKIYLTKNSKLYLWYFILLFLYLIMALSSCYFCRRCLSVVIVIIFSHVIQAGCSNPLCMFVLKMSESHRLPSGFICIKAPGCWTVGNLETTWPRLLKKASSSGQMIDL